MKKREAVLDASFWSVGYLARIDEYLPLYFRLLVPVAVEAEIMAQDVRDVELLYPYSQLYQLVKEAGHMQALNPSRKLGLYGKGEDPAISLARERGALLLINDARPYHFARSLGIKSLTVPGFIVFLTSQNRIRVSAALAKLNAIAPHTSQELMEEARELVQGLKS